jgi:hypothetical protein
MHMPSVKNTDRPAVVEHTQLEAEAFADRRARTILGAKSREEAFRRLDAGELRGTAAEAEFRNLRWLLTGK